MLRGGNQGVPFLLHEGLVETLDLVAWLEAGVEVVAPALFGGLRPPLPTVLELSRRHSGPLNHDIQLSRIFAPTLHVLSGHRFSHTLSILVGILVYTWFIERFAALNWPSGSRLMIPTTFGIENWVCLTLCKELLSSQLLLLLLSLLVMFSLLSLDQSPMLNILRSNLVKRRRLGVRKLLILDSHIILQFIFEWSIVWNLDLVIWMIVRIHHRGVVLKDFGTL